MLSPEPYLVFTRRLEAQGLRYMVTGSVAAMSYGEPRFTNDVDIVIVLPVVEVASFWNAFPSEEFYCPPPEILEMEVRRDQRGHFNLIHQETGFKADFYPVKRDPLHHWGLAHVRKVALEEDQIFLAPPEYVMVRKLEYYREGQSSKHLRDIQRMLVGLGPAWSRVDLLKLIEAHGLQVEWAQVPPIPD